MGGCTGFRRRFMRAFLSGGGIAAARRAIPVAVEHRLTDGNFSADDYERTRKRAAGASGA